MAGDRRALSNVGGPVEARGDAAFRFPLTAAMQAQDETIDPGLTHGFHAYPARMHPNLARVVLREFFVGPGSEVLDPFCGSGTVAVEALVGGWKALGSDLDPLALRIARVKTERRGDKSRERFLARVRAVAAASERRVRERVDVRANLSAEERSWYEVHVLKELAGLLEEIRAVSDERDRQAMEMVFSAIVVKFSRQRAETAAREAPKRVRKGLVTEFFVRKAEELVEGWSEVSAELARRDQPSHAPRFVLSDARSLPQTLAGEYRCDLILTSPPYGGTYDYLHHHARRHAWLGINAKGLRSGEIGARRHFSGGRSGSRAPAQARARGPAQVRERWDSQVTDVLQAIAALLRPEGVALLLVGDADIAGDRVPADVQLERLAPIAEMQVVAVASQPRPDWRRGPDRREHLVALRRSAGADHYT
jgi:SAM-dependent methyltransferase